LNFVEIGRAVKHG